MILQGDKLMWADIRNHQGSFYRATLLHVLCFIMARPLSSLRLLLLSFAFVILSSSTSLFSKGLFNEASYQLIFIHFHNMFLQLFLRLPHCHDYRRLRRPFHLHIHRSLRRDLHFVSKTWFVIVIFILLCIAVFNILFTLLCQRLLMCLYLQQGLQGEKS